MLRTMSGIRIFTPFSRLVSKDARSNFRSSSARSPVSIAIPGFRSFDRRISSGSWAGASSGHTASKSTPLIDNKSLSRFGDASIPTTFMESSSAGISQSGQSSTKVDGVSNPKPFIADQSGGTAGTGNGIASGSVSTVAGSASVSSTADKATVANQALMPRGLSNAGGAPSGNAAQASASTINAGGPNAKVPAPNNQRLGGVAGPTQSKTSSSTGTTSPNIEKLAWLTEIVNTREALEEGMDGGGLIPRLQKSGPHTFADLMAALRKGSHFNDEIISDMQTEGQWDQLLNAAGISPKDRTEHGGSKLGWLTRIVNKREGLEEAIDDRGVVMRLQRTGPHTFTELMAALRNGSHFSDAVIADMKSEGQWDQILRASGINPSDIGKQDIMSKTKNTATNIKVKTDQAAALKSTNADVQAGPHLSTGQQIMTSGSATNVDVQAGHHHLSTGQQIMTSGSATNVDVQAGHHHLSTGQQIMTSGSATPVDQTANSKSAVVSQKEANTDGSKTITGGSSGTVSQSKVSLKDVQTRSVPENGIASDCSGNAAGTNGKNSGQKYW